MSIRAQSPGTWANIFRAIQQSLWKIWPEPAAWLLPITSTRPQILMDSPSEILSADSLSAKCLGDQGLSSMHSSLNILVLR